MDKKHDPGLRPNLILFLILLLLITASEGLSFPLFVINFAKLIALLAGMLLAMLIASITIKLAIHAIALGIDAVCVYNGLGFRFPGKTVPRHQGESNENTVAKSQIQYSPQSSDILFAIEAVRSTPLGKGVWEINLYFAIYNRGNSEVSVYDMHANTYFTSVNKAFLPMNVKYRDGLDIFETNSLVENNKVYVMPSQSSVDVRLSLELSYWECDKENAVEPHEMVTVFGIYVDYRTLQENGLIQMQIPVDCLFIFQNSESGHLISINEANLPTYLQKHGSNLANRNMLRKIGNTLIKHNSISYILS